MTMQKLEPLEIAKACREHIAKGTLIAVWAKNNNKPIPCSKYFYTPPGTGIECRCAIGAVFNDEVRQRMLTSSPPGSSNIDYIGWNSLTLSRLLDGADFIELEQDDRTLVFDLQEAHDKWASVPQDARVEQTFMNVLANIENTKGRKNMREQNC